ncbi:unnamed protein product [Nezara viridula]|uniref:Uncharacterized protein n=1 Tax=Nezara viridula TaxID=85310 RepID=A0A9P0ECU1_NEZVI|nr:unnamed protein product [Nezara viridula]CAH1394151.1 unnamed protein product [Nezara viridula]
MSESKSDSRLLKEKEDESFQRIPIKNIKWQETQRMFSSEWNSKLSDEEVRQQVKRDHKRMEEKKK